MRWSRSTDYHGSRSYEQDRPAVRQSGLMLAWLMNILRQKWRKLAPPTTSSSETLPAGEHGFSLLGATSGKSLERAADCPFPMAHTSRLRHEN